MATCTAVQAQILAGEAHAAPRFRPGYRSPDSGRRPTLGSTSQDGTFAVGRPNPGRTSCARPHAGSSAQPQSRAPSPSRRCRAEHPSPVRELAPDCLGRAAVAEPTRDVDRDRERVVVLPAGRPPRERVPDAVNLATRDEARRAARGEPGAIEDATGAPAAPAALVDATTWTTVPAVWVTPGAALALDAPGPPDSVRLGGPRPPTGPCGRVAPTGSRRYCRAAPIASWQRGRRIRCSLSRSSASRSQAGSRSRSSS